MVHSVCTDVHALLRCHTASAATASETTFVGELGEGLEALAVRPVELSMQHGRAHSSETTRQRACT